MMVVERICGSTCEVLLLPAASVIGFVLVRHLFQ